MCAHVKDGIRALPREDYSIWAPRGHEDDDKGEMAFSFFDCLDLVNVHAHRHMLQLSDTTITNPTLLQSPDNNQKLVDTKKCGLLSWLLSAGTRLSEQPFLQPYPTASDASTQQHKETQDTIVTCNAPIGKVWASTDI